MQIDIIGDIHGCFQEFKNLTLELGYQWSNGFPLHQAGRKLAFVGDLTDRGPQSLKVIESCVGACHEREECLLYSG